MKIVKFVSLFERTMLAFNKRTLLVNTPL